MFANKAQEMFCSSSNHHFISFQVHKTNSVPNKIPPGTCISAHEQCVILSLFYFMNHQCLRIIYHLTIAVEVFIIKRNKLHKNVVVQYQLHSICILLILVSNKTFA